MNTQILSTNLEITPAIRDYVEKKILISLKNIDHVIEAKVSLSVEKIRKTAEIRLQCRGKTIFVQHSNDNMYAAIDGLSDRLDRQMSKYKTKGISRRKEKSIRRTTPA